LNCFFRPGVGFVPRHRRHDDVIRGGKYPQIADLVQQEKRREIVQALGLCLKLATDLSGQLALRLPHACNRNEGQADRSERHHRQRQIDRKRPTPGPKIGELRRRTSGHYPIQRHNTRSDSPSARSITP
jgi:hypothetical protein